MAVLRIVLVIIAIFLTLFVFRVVRGFWSTLLARLRRRKS